MNNGYIKLHRKILESPIVMKSNDHFALWMYLLLNATHKGYDTIYEGQRKTLKPGQLITGRKVIAKALKINESKIQRILKTFEIEQQIEQQTNPRCRLITVLNWNEYQLDEQQTEQQVNNKRTLNKNVKNVKNNTIRENEFINQCKKIYKNYEIDDVMLVEFIDYWTEGNIGGKKMKFEMQQTFDIGRRLSKWKGNHKRWEKPKKEYKKPFEARFNKYKSGLYEAYCSKCGSREMPNDKWQLKEGSNCCRVDYTPTRPEIQIDNSKQVMRMLNEN